MNERGFEELKTYLTHSMQTTDLLLLENIQSSILWSTHHDIYDTGAPREIESDREFGILISIPSSVFCKEFYDCIYQEPSNLF
jgi:hypothetical protein